MTIREEAKWCIQQDGMLAEIRKKIRSGKADYEDTAAYSARAGKMIGALFSRRLPEIPPEEREQLCVELLHDQYIDINAAVDAAQRYLDERLGIQLAPQHAPFDSERGHQIGSALRDLSKPVETLQRRARAATETTVKSMHDDRMKTEAKFRSRAGLKCIVNRIAAAKCCEWCDQVAGKYAYEDTPPDLWRRHDNCNCTIVYGTRRDRQVLRGTEKKWEIVAEGAGAPEPVRLTPEQAKKLQEKHQLKRLTNSSEKRIIKLSINLFDPSDPIYLDALSIEEEPGFEDVHLHGSPSSVEKIINGKKKLFSADEFAKLLKQSGYTSGDIRLCSCSTGQGDNSFAQKLSRILGCKVKAPDDDVYYIPEDGVMFIGSQFGNTGKWRIFDKGVEVT